MSENLETKNTVKIKSEKLDDLLDFVKSNEQIKELTKNLKPAGVSVNVGKDFVEIKLTLTKNGISDYEKIK